jgi:hypothetical protein
MKTYHIETEGKAIYIVMDGLRTRVEDEEEARELMSVIGRIEGGE